MEKSFLKQLVSSTVFTFTSLSASLPRSSRLKQESCTWSCRLVQLFCYQKCSVTWLWHYTQFCIKVYVAVIPTYHHRSTESCCDYYFNAFSVLKIVLTIFHSEYGQSYHMRTMRIITGYKMWNSGIFCLICHHINKQKKKHKCSHEVKKYGNLYAFSIPPLLNAYIVCILPTWKRWPVFNKWHLFFLLHWFWHSSEHLKATHF